MKAFARAAALAGIAAGFSGQAWAERAGEDFRWQGRLAAGQAVEIKGVNGDIEAVAATGDEVEVLAVKSGRRSDPSEVTIEVVTHGGGVTLCAVYPASGRGRANECAPGEGGRMDTSNNDVEVRFTVQVPKGVRFVGRTVNGGIQIAQLDGDVEAYSVNGGVRIDTRGNARAETVNGSITASMGRSDWSGSAAFETVNGGITLALPADAGAEVSAETVNGSIETDFPLTVRGKFSGRRVSGTLGSGGRELRLETVNGSIRLRKAP
jgi:DUF4097 and DUF4098 domain-containing protein YvlB